MQAERLTGRTKHIHTIDNDVVGMDTLTISRMLLTCLPHKVKCIRVSAVGHRKLRSK